MRGALLASALMLIAPLAMADPSQVPAIANANASTAAGGVANADAKTSATGARASASSASFAANPASPATPPAGMPPAINRLSPSASLNAKERSSAQMAQAWRNHNDRPSRSEDGVLRWTFGASLPSVVCSPLQVCDVALQPGEVVNSIHIGDKVRWSVMPGVAGGGLDRTTHLIVKPSDAGLISSMLVYTDKRIYSIKLISTQSQWTPLTAFTYPQSAEAAWANYGATVVETTGPGKSVPAGAGSGADLDFDYGITSDASWRPIRVYSVAGKTFIQFPKAMQYGSAPALIGLAHDGSWFSSPSETMLRYRIAGDRYVVDGLLDHAELVSGVGSAQSKVEIRRSH